MELVLSDESSQIIRRKLESGAYPSAEEIVAVALKLLEDHDEDRLTALREEIALGIEQADRGELIDGDEVFAEVRNQLVDQRSIS